MLESYKSVVHPRFPEQPGQWMYFEVEVYSEDPLSQSWLETLFASIRGQSLTASEVSDHLRQGLPCENRLQVTQVMPCFVVNS